MTADTRETPERYRLLACDLVYDGYFKIIRYHLVHQLFAGGEGPELSREIFERGRAVAVLPYDPVRDEVVLIEQFRPGAIGVEPDPWLIETVAGIVEADERLEDVAHREAKEEAGLDLLALRHIFRYFASPGGSTETVDLFLARVETSHAGGLFGLVAEGEDVKVHVLSCDEAMDWLDRGRIQVATTIIALQWLKLNKDKIVADWRDRLPVEATGQVV